MTEGLQGGNGLRIAVIDTDSGFLQVFGKRLERMGWEHRVLASAVPPEQLDRTLEALEHQDVELASFVIADDDRIDGRYLEVHQGILSLLALQAPVAGDLRVVAALLHVIKHAERMGDQCVNVAKLLPVSGYEAPRDDELETRILRMGQLASEGRLTGPMASLGKLHNTRAARAVIDEARDLLGGNGILLDFHVMRHMADMEAIHTYEGTETIQTLIVGRDITGVGAFA